MKMILMKQVFGIFVRCLEVWDFSGKTKRSKRKAKVTIIVSCTLFRVSTSGEVLP